MFGNWSYAYRFIGWGMTHQRSLDPQNLFRVNQNIKPAA